MAYSTISKPGLHFNTVLWAGNNAARSITGVGHAPDWVWIKDRGGTNAHCLFDSVRGGGKYLSTVGNGAELTNPSSGYVSSFDSDGFSGVTGSSSYANWNGSGNNYVAWNWKAGGAGSANTDGSINSTVSVNQTAGFSIVSFTGTGANATVGHGLGAVPKMIIQKNRSISSAWSVWHNSFTGAQVIYFNETGAVGTNTSSWNSTVPTSSVFSVGTGSYPNGSGNTQIYYVFSEIKGYSNFGSYRGNGNADGTFVYTGFKPAFVVTKMSSGSDNWALWDNKRDSFNVNDNILRVDTSAAETSNAAYAVDFLSNGFKLRGSDGKINGNGSTYIYMAFAEEPLVANVGNSIPATAG